MAVFVAGQAFDNNPAVAPTDSPKKLRRLLRLSFFTKHNLLSCFDQPITIPRRLPA
jgi:hypothetical protein